MTSALDGSTLVAMRAAMGRAAAQWPAVQQVQHSYDEKDVASLVAAKRYGFTVVSMKRDWRRIFAFQTQT